jgi:exopolysaccharide biosynthesis protein
MGDQINVWLDDLSALFWRLSQFPIAFQLLIWLLSAGLFWFVFFFLWKKFVAKNSNEKSLSLWWMGFVLVGLPIVFAVIIDARQTLAKEESELRSANIDPVVEVSKDSLYSSEVQLDTVPLGDLGIPKTRTIWAKPGIEVIEMKFQNPNAYVVLAIADLNYFSVELDSLYKEKELTSSFAKQYKCEIAVNGEAGTTPGMNAPLGQWTGNYIVNGKPYKLEDSDKRPFLYFNKQGKGFYSKDRDVVRIPSSEMYNAIWGRYDLIVNGKEFIDSRDGTKENAYPRTIMGIDESGKKLFLLIADGRKPQHSRGLTMKECASLLLPYGCYQAMSCDQGGSSCMYVEKFGIVNRPGDGGERPVYTHFGLRRN